MLKQILSHAMIFLIAAIIAGCAPRKAQEQLPPQERQGYNDAVDLQQKFREMADQMLATVPNEALDGYVAMPTAFVNENNTSQTSPLGRLIAESMLYEFNQRGFPTREYLFNEGVPAASGRNDAGRVAGPNGDRKWAALLSGTYQVTKDATFVNARLVRSSDGLVLRTAEIILPNTPLVLSLAAGSGGAASAQGQAGNAGRAYVAPQSAPVLPPSYPTLAGPVIGSGTGYIPIIQGR